MPYRLVNLMGRDVHVPQNYTQGFFPRFLWQDANGDGIDEFVAPLGNNYQIAMLQFDHSGYFIQEFIGLNPAWVGINNVAGNLVFADFNAWHHFNGMSARNVNEIFI